MRAGAIIGGFAINLAALNAAVATLVGTCTQGDASQLGAACVISIPLYVFGFAAVFACRPPLAARMTLAPALLLIGWQSWIAVRLVVIWVSGQGSACDVLLDRDHGEMITGDERSYALLWACMSVVCWIGLGAIWRRSSVIPAATLSGATE